MSCSVKEGRRSRPFHLYHHFRRSFCKLRTTLFRRRGTSIRVASVHPGQQEQCFTWFNTEEHQANKRSQISTITAPSLPCSAEPNHETLKPLGDIELVEVSENKTGCLPRLQMSMYTGQNMGMFRTIESNGSVESLGLPRLTTPFKLFPFQSLLGFSGFS